MHTQAGYDTINSEHHFTIPGSFSSRATGSSSLFRQGSNVNTTGRWVFRTDGGDRVQGCSFNGKAKPECGNQSNYNKISNDN